MSSKLGNVLPIFINIRKWVGLLFNSGLLHKFTQVKVKEVCLTEWTLNLKKKLSFSLKSTIVKLALL